MGQQATDAKILVPAHFPIMFQTLLMKIPHLQGEVGQDVQQVVIDFINDAFCASIPQDMVHLHQIGVFLSLMPKLILQDIANSIAATINMSWLQPERSFIWLKEILDSHTMSLESRFIPWLTKQLQDEEILGFLQIPLTTSNINHLFNHVRINIKPHPGTKLSMTVTECSRNLYTPKPTQAMVDEFVDHLQAVPMERLAENDRICIVCRAPYGEVGSFLDCQPEGAVRLPCAHHVGKKCLTVLLGPKPRVTIVS